MSNNQEIRLQKNWSGKPIYEGEIIVCPHIIIQGQINTENMEYIEVLTIHCNECNKDYLFDIAIN